MDEIFDPIPEEPTDQDPDSGPLLYRERFVFKQQIKMSGDVESVVTTVDITGVDNDNEALGRILRAFFGFLENVDFESRMVYDKTMDLLLTTRMREENPESFGKNISISPDAGFEAFLVRLRTFDQLLIKELYQIYIGARSLN